MCAGHRAERGSELQGPGLGLPLDRAAPAQRQEPRAAGDAARAAVQGQQVPVRAPGVAAAPGRQGAAAGGHHRRLGQAGRLAW